MHVCSGTPNGCGDSRTLVGVSQLLHMRKARVHPWENSLTLGLEKMRLGSSQLLRLDAARRSRWDWERDRVTLGARLRGLERCAQRVGHPHELGQRPGFHLPHDLSTMNLNSHLAQVELCCYLLVR